MENIDIDNQKMIIYKNKSYYLECISTKTGKAIINPKNIYDSFPDESIEVDIKDMEGF